MLITDKKIAIAGGGPGGLTLARLLQMKGADVTVYERDLNREVRVQGATLDLHEESGLAALAAAGLMPAFRENYRPDAGRLRIVDKAGVIRMDEHDHIDFGDLRPEIDRGPLRNILLDALLPGTVTWNSHFVSMAPAGNGWKLLFRNGAEAYADIVIAADGANSKIRPLITDIKPFYAGITAVEGAVHHSATASPHVHALLNGGKIFAFGDSKSLIVSSKGDGSFAFYMGCKTDEHWAKDSGINFSDKAQVADWFRKEFTGWDEMWAEMIDHADAVFIPRPQYCMPLDQSWEALPNLTMLGDAAHLMPPYAGEGVNMAMLDALELSVCLTSNDFPDTRSAIAHYEQQMRKRAAAAAQMTLDSTTMLHGDDAVNELVRAFSAFGEQG